jgi:hypothetical protein
MSLSLSLSVCHRSYRRGSYIYNIIGLQKIGNGYLLVGNIKYNSDSFYNIYIMFCCHPVSDNSDIEKTMYTRRSRLVL